jgi:hypothetical protein
VEQFLLKHKIKNHFVHLSPITYLSHIYLYPDKSTIMAEVDTSFISSHGLHGNSNSNGELLTVMTPSFHPIWNDKGSGGSRDGAFWEPLAQGPLRPVGSVAVDNYGDVNGRYMGLLVAENPSSSTGPAPVASPRDYTELWNDKGTGANQDGSVWRPIPPNGYVVLGDVFQHGYSKPDTNRIWCVRQDLIKPARFGSQSTWDDKNTGAKTDLSVWEVHGNLVSGELNASQINSFRCSQNYNPPDSSYAVLPLV